MPPANGKTVADLAQSVAELTGRVADLTRRVELTEAARGNGIPDQEREAVVRAEDDASPAIEFITENGYSIVRPWESRGLPAPANGKCRFGVSDGFIEREITVEISRGAVAEISLRTRGRIQLSNSFWICCAERHLANYVSEHADFPERNELMVESLDPEDIVLALRWETT
jgi:hypothetical protein